jgi:hypothetical protein
MERVQGQKFRSEWQDPYQAPYQMGGTPYPERNAMIDSVFTRIVRPGFPAVIVLKTTR